MIVDRLQENLITTIRFLTDGSPGLSDPAPITGLSYNTAGISIGYKKPGDTTWTDLTLVEGTLGTYLSSSFVEDSGLDGNYELGIPNDSKVAGKRTIWRFKFGANKFRYDSIDYVAIPADNGQLGFDIRIPGSEVIFASESASVYVKETGLTIVLQANVNIEAIPIKVVFEQGDGTDDYIVNDGDITKSGDTAEFAMPAGFTDTADTNYNWSVRHATTNRLYGTGTLGVDYAPYDDSLDA